MKAQLSAMLGKVLKDEATKDTFRVALREAAKPSSRRTESKSLIKIDGRPYRVVVESTAKK